MKIKPVILCGGAGTRLWPDSKHNIPKQFIDFGGWTLLKKTLERIKNPIFDSPIISTNIKYFNLTKKFLIKYKIKKYTIVLEPYKKNTAAAVLSTSLLKEVDFDQPIVFFPSESINVCLDFPTKFDASCMPQVFNFLTFSGLKASVLMIFKASWTRVCDDLMFILI